MNEKSNSLFIDIELNSSTLDIYLVRKRIFESLKYNLNEFTGSLLDIGCGKMPYKEFMFSNSAIKEYTGLDIDGAFVYDRQIKPDYTWNGIEMPFSDNSFDCAIATEVLEHCPKPAIVLNEVLRVLKPKSVFFFTVPFIWPLHEVPYDEFRYTPFSLKRLLEEAGFEKIKLSALGGWHAALAQMLGLWVRRSPLKGTTKKFLSFVFKPVIKYLINKDTHFAVSFSESQMITGLYGIAFKGE